MIRRLALRDRLAIVFAIALFVVYVIFAGLAVIIVNREISGAIDGRLHTIVEATRAIIDTDAKGKFRADTRDRSQFRSIAAEATGAIVVRADGSLILGTTDDPPDWVTAELRNATGERLVRSEDSGAHVQAIIAPLAANDPAAPTIIVWQSLEVERDLTRTVVLVVAAFGVVIAVAGYALGAQIARRGLAPLTRMAAVVSDIEAHDLSLRVGRQPHDDELGRLAATFDRMLDRLEGSFERQRRFTADASHDLRAPLATLRAEVDLALRRERSTADYRTALTAVAHDADRLNELIDALLAAARSDAGDLALEATDLAKTTHVSVQRIAAFALAKHVTIDENATSPVTISADGALLERAILAILHNAVKYTPESSTIHVEVEATPDVACVRIRDAGPGFSDAALHHAFERFWRDDSARGRSGSGLGLAIVQAIVTRCGGRVRVANAVGGGGIVEAEFPRIVPSPVHTAVMFEA